MTHKLLPAVTVLLAMVVATSAFLATPLNTTDPDVIDILCPDQTTGVTRDHKWITREAIRRNIRQFFLDNPPPSNPAFHVPADASLSQLYHAYYGAAASPARFINAVNSIAASNVRADSSHQTRYDPGIQADGEDFDDLQKKLSARYPQLLTSILVNEAYAAARSLLGVSLHSIQKFYAHSTWIEAGNTDILYDLGLPGGVIGGTAGADEDVCAPCPSSQGTCDGNVLDGAGLTTGYYQYEDENADGFLISKPSSGGKCSHGGVLDSSAAHPAVGGINKDTASPCFSPHHHLHQQAAELALQATDHYLNVVLEAVGSERYRRLFDLYQGSALSIVIDTTFSMGDEINAVKAQVAEIVDVTPTEIYILVPYRDPKVGPLTKTTDPVAFMDAVNKLRPNGGGDGPEMYWHGLELGLANTPDYGNVFSFTDAPAKDGEIMESVISLAEQRHIKVSIIYSGKLRSSAASPDEDPDVEGLNDTRWITRQEEYERLAEMTGGLFIPSGDFDINAITPILGESVQSVDVDITILKELTGANRITLPIDDSILDFSVQLVGHMSDALLHDMTGMEYDLLDDAGLVAAGAEVVITSDALRVIRFDNPRFGAWTLNLDAADSYSVTVSSNSSLSWLGSFSILDPSPPHPHYRETVGRPLTKTVYYLDVTLIGYLENNVVNVHNIEYIDESGVILRNIPYYGDIDYEFYIRSEPLPEQPFNVRLCGHLHSGCEFCRLMPVLITPVQVSVEVLATSEELSARPGENTTGTFLVTNYGLESDFRISATDDMFFLTGISPSTLHLRTNESDIVIAYFTVSEHSAPGTVTTVIVTAQSVKQTQSVNSAVTQLVVLPKTEDTEAPLCTLASTPDCTGYMYSGICDQKNWTVEATLRDPASGLSNAYAVPEGFWSKVSGLTPSTTSEVTVTYGASCCNTQVDIIGVDTMGNVGKCRIDMGELGGMILDLEVEAVGVTWVALRWSLTTTNLELRKYSLLVDDDFTSQFPCPQSTCRYNVTYLEACSRHTFQLTPFFSQGGGVSAGLPAFTEANTLDIQPMAPSNGKQLNASISSATITWDAVTSECVNHYQVCRQPHGFPGSEVCERTGVTVHELSALEACAKYKARVAAVTSSGLPSDTLEFYVNSDEAEPEAPRNVAVHGTTKSAVSLGWDDPLHRVHCIDKYRITYGEIDGKVRTIHVSTTQNLATISNLQPCTNYSFVVSAVSKTGLTGPGAVRDAATAETDDPLPVDVLQLEPSTTTATALQVSWKSSEKCLDHFKVCYYELSVPMETCVNEENSKTNLINLKPCTNYIVAVTTVTPSGIESNKTYGTASTLEINPGEPENLQVLKQAAHSIEISFDPPSVGFECVTQYDFQIINVDGHSRVTVSSTALEPYKNSVFNNLEACTNYRIKVRSVTPGQLISTWVSVTSTTLQDTPTAPRSFQLLQATDTTLELQWWKPMENTLCVAQYDITWLDDLGNEGSETVMSGSEESLPIVVSTLHNLNPCTHYNLSVTASSAGGLISEAATLTATTSGCPPR